MNSCSVQLRTLQSAVAVTANPNTTGAYELSAFPDGSYNLSASSTKPWGGAYATDALRACQNLGSGWRLPSFEELYHMYQKSSTTSSTRVGSKGAWCQETDHTGEPLLLSFDGTTHTAGHWVGDVNTDMFHYFVVLVKEL